MVGCGFGVDGCETGGGAGVAAVRGDCDIPVGREEADYCAGGVGLDAEGSQSRGKDEGGAHVDYNSSLAVVESVEERKKERFFFEMATSPYLYLRALIRADDYVRSFACKSRLKEGPQKLVACDDVRHWPNIALKTDKLLESGRDKFIVVVC